MDGMLDALLRLAHQDLHAHYMASNTVKRAASPNARGSAGSAAALRRLLSKNSLDIPWGPKRLG